MMKSFLILFLAACMATSVAAPSRVQAQDDDLSGLFDDETDAETPPAVPPPPAAGDFNNQNNLGAPPPAGDFNNADTSGASGSGGNSFGDNSQAAKLKAGARKTPRLKSNPVKTAAKGSKPPISTAGPEDITNDNYPDLIESFDYPNAEITDVVKAISELTGKNFIVDPGVRGKITIMAPTQITVAEAYKAFLSALAINGFTVVPSGKFLKIVPTRTAARSNIETYSGAYYPNSDVMITRIVKLKHISADEVNKNLRFLPTKDGEMNPYAPTNSLIITDYGSNIDRIMKILGELDQPGFEELMVVLPIHNAKAKDLADLIMQIINKQPKSSSASNGFGGFNAGVPRFPVTSGTNGHNGMPEELSLVAPDDRTNAIIVVGNRTGVDKIRTLVKKLDYKLDPTQSGGVYVYSVKYGEAEKLATTFQGLTSSTAASGNSGAAGGGLNTGFRGFTPPAEQRAVFGGDVKITADKTNNSLVISASKQDYQVVLSLLAKLDVPRDQVFIETYIAEMNVTRTKQYDVNIVRFQPEKDANGNPIAGPKAGFIGSSPSTLASLLTPTGGTGALLGFGTGQSLQIQAGTGTNATTTTVPSLLALMNFLVSKTDTNILSTPQILALNNEEAEIEVGQKIATSRSTATGANGITQGSATFEDATTKMNITPYISPDSEDIRLKIIQSFKTPSQAPSQIDNTVNLDTRSIKTNIVVRNGDTAVLGGLIKDQEVTRETKVPLLGDIPVLGWLFRSSDSDIQKLNLMVFLSPKIIRNSQDARGLLAKKRVERIDWVKRHNDGRDPFGRAIGQLPPPVTKSKSRAEGEKGYDTPPDEEGAPDDKGAAQPEKGALNSRGLVIPHAAPGSAPVPARTTASARPLATRQKLARQQAQKKRRLKTTANDAYVQRYRE